jgi:preprotein translocase subunit SecG
MTTVLMVIHLLLALALVGVILVQRSEGGGLGMGSSGGGGFMSARAKGNLLTKLTAILFAGFVVTSMTLAIISTNKDDPSKILTDGTQTEAKDAAEGENKAVEPQPEVEQIPTEPSVPIAE